MKTYTTNQRLGRLTAYLVAVMKPFVFDGTVVQFVASEDFIRCMFAEDPMIAKIDFDIL